MKNLNPEIVRSYTELFGDLFKVIENGIDDAGWYSNERNGRWFSIPPHLLGFLDFCNENTEFRPKSLGTGVFDFRRVPEMPKMPIQTRDRIVDAIDAQPDVLQKTTAALSSAMSGKSTPARPTLDEIFKDAPQLIKDPRVIKLIAYVEEQHNASMEINRRYRGFYDCVFELVMYSELVMISGKPAKDALKDILELCGDF